MGPLRLTLRHLDISSSMLTPFPLPLTQLVALEHLNAEENEFAELPPGMTALSRLTELMLGRYFNPRDPLQTHVKRPLDARSLGDLLRFPALQEVTSECCEVMLCRSVLGAARHASLTSICFCIAHPAPECTPVVLQLVRELWRLRRGSVLKAVSERRDVYGSPAEYGWDHIDAYLEYEQGRAPCQKFMADLEACRQEARGL